MRVDRLFYIEDEQRGPDQRVGISGYLPWLFFISLGLFLTVAIPAAIFFSLFALSSLVSAALYLFGLVVTTLVISEGESRPLMWISRLVLPLPAAGLAWWGFTAMGF